jgi:hypothetical protein
VTHEERARRIGENEALFRVVNERIEHLNRAFAVLTETMDVVCECGDIDCAERLVLTVSDYERVRADPTHFAVVPGHELPDVERVVERGDGFVVVRKDPGLPAQVARETDPRS